MTQKRRYFSGESETQAILEAAGYYGVAPEDLAFERVEKRTGFIKRRRKVLIEVDPGAPARREREASGAAGRGASEAGPKGPGVVARSAPEVVPREAEAPPASPGDDEAAAGEAEEARWAVGEEERPAADGEGPGGDEAGPEAAGEDDGEADGEDDGEPDDRRAAGSRAEGDEEAHRGDGDEEEARAAAEEDGDDEDEDEDAEGLTPLDPGAVREAMIQLLVLSDLDVEPTVREDGQNLGVDLAGPESEFVIEEEGSVLAAFDYLLNRMVRRRGRRDAWVRVDCEGFRAARDERLRQRAREAAASVRERGEPVVFEPLRASARRIVHLAVQDEAGVDSVSEGRGRLKRVRVVPAD